MNEAERRRRQAREDWNGVAPGWARQQEELERTARPVSEWLADAVQAQPGHRLLDVATGTGATALLLAERVAPEGDVLGVDVSDGMLATARARAQAAGVADLRFERMDADRLALTDAEWDGATCRWGYMLMPDPLAALAETHRVLRPGARHSLAVWDVRASNPWIAAPSDELLRRGLAEPPDPSGPGMFSLAGDGKLAAVLERAGFRDPAVEGLDIAFRFPSMDGWWAYWLDMSHGFAPAVERLAPAERDDLRAGLAAALAPWTAADGSLALPGRVLVAVATA